MSDNTERRLAIIEQRQEYLLRFLKSISMFRTPEWPESPIPSVPSPFGGVSMTCAACYGTGVCSICHGTGMVQGIDDPTGQGRC